MKSQSLPDRALGILRAAVPGQILAVLLIGAGLVLRLVDLADRPLWYDEAIAILLARTGPAEIVQAALGSEAGTAANVHPPLYFFVLWGWGRLLGDSVVAARILSGLCGIGAMVTIGLLAKEMFGRRAGWAASALLALAPFQVHYAREARMYALLTLLMLLATLAAWRGVRHPGRRLNWFLLGLFSALGMYTHILAAFYLAVLYILLACTGSAKARRGAIAAAGLGLLLFLPWLLQLPAQIAKVSQGYWVAPPGWVELLQTLLAFLAGMPLIGIGLPIGLFGALLVIALGGYLAVRFVDPEERRSRPLLWAASLAFGPMLLLFMVSRWRPVYIHRGLLPSAAAALLMLAWAMTSGSIPRSGRGLMGVALALAFACGLGSDFGYRGFPYAPYPAINAYIAERRTGQDIVLHSNKLTALPAIYYDPSLPHHFLADPPGSGSDTLALPTQAVLGIRADKSPAEAAQGAERVFFLVFERELEEYARLDDGQHPHLFWLWQHFGLLGQSRWDDLLLFEFAKSPAPAALRNGVETRARTGTSRMPGEDTSSRMKDGP